jgi:hypothetical protein
MSLIIAIFDFMHATSMYVMYINDVSINIVYCAKLDCKKFGASISLSYLDSPSILLLQVFIQRAKFFKNLNNQS